MLGKLLGLVTVGGTLASVGVMHRFLLRMVNIIILAIASAFMACALLASMFYTAYFCLVRYGVPAYDAGIMLSATALLITTVLTVMTLWKLRQLRDLSCHGFYKDGEDRPDIGKVAAAFIEGFLTPKK